MTLREEPEEEIAGDHALVEPSSRFVLTDFDRRRAELVQLGQITQQMPLVLAQLQQLQLSPPRRRGWGMLAYPLILLGLSGISSMALPMMLNVEGAKSVESDTTPVESNELILNATCILGDQRMAIINGRTYKPKDLVRKPNSSDPPYVIKEIFPNRVVLDCNGKQVQLAYTDRRATDNNANTRQTSSISAAGSSEKNLPAGDQSDLNQILEKLKNGELGLRDIPRIVSGLSKNHN